MYKAILFTLDKVKKSNKNIFYFFIFLSIFYSILSFGTTLIFKEIIDTVNGSNTFLHFTILGVLIFKVCFDIFAGVINSIREYLLPVIKRNSSLFFIDELVEKTATLDISSLEDPKTVGIISRAYSRIHIQFEYYFKNIVQLLTSTIEIVLALAIFYIASPIGAILLLLSNLISTIVKAKLGGSNFNIYKANYETRLKFGYATDLLNQRETLLELKLFQNFNYIKDKILNIYNSFITKEINHQKHNQIIANFIELIPILSSFVFTLILANQLQTNLITVGSFVFLFTNMLIFSGAMGRFGYTMISVAEESNSIKDIIEFYELESKMSYRNISSKDELKKMLEDLKHPSISFTNVSFRYPNSDIYVLKNINIDIPYSQNVALIGENGAGKTTLIKLLLRVYDPTEGNILINNININNIPVEVLYKCFGTLFQNFGKFNLTVRENLELAANKKISDKEMVDNLKYANAWKFIKNTNDGLDQQLGPEYKNGVDLSGGQWQSLAIARTYSKEAPIVILDEPTSSIDIKSEMQIFDRLIKKMKNETLIFISHRFTTIKDAERIIVLEKGKVVEDGDHDKLIKNNGKYAHLYNIQVSRLQRNKQ